MNFINTHTKKSTYTVLLFTLLCLSMTVTCTKHSKSAIAKDIMVSEKISEEAIAKSWKLLQKGQQWAEKGKSMAEILKNLPDSTLVQTNANSIIFFIKNSIPMLIELPQKEDLNGITKSMSLSNSKTTFAITKTISSYSLRDENIEIDIVASQKGEAHRQAKKALILSPYVNTFGDDDDGLVAKKYLETNRNYKGNVVFKTKNLTLEDYQNLDEYDLVHLSSHGNRFCNAAVFADGSEIEIIRDGDSNFCRTIIDTGIKHSFTKKEEINKFLSDNPQYKNIILISKKTIFLRSSFFTHFYAAGLKNKIWIFSACQLGQRSDLKEAMRSIHNNGHFYYWLNTVYARDAKPAFEKLYENLINEGLDAKKSFDAIPDNLKKNLPSEYNDSIKTTTELIYLQMDSPRHGIEIIEMWHPEDKKLVTKGVFYPVIGDFGDGNNETLTLKVQLKGYTKAEFEDQKTTLSLKVDDNTVLHKQSFLPNSSSNIEVKDLENHEYGIEVTINDIPIPDVGEKEKITLTAYLHLNEENFTIHKEQVTIKANGVKATMTGFGNTMVLTFDDKRRAQKIESSQMPSTAYTDDNGYLYINTAKQGWTKMQVTKFMGNAMSMGTMPDNSALNKMMENSGSSNIFFSITEWGLRFRKIAFEANTNFKKQLVDCGKAEKCTKFIGIAGEEAGVTALFQPSGRLKELNFNGLKTKYEYGEYTVIIPKAKEISLGI